MMVNIIAKKHHTERIILILLVTGIVTLLAIPDTKFTSAQSITDNSTSEIETITSLPAEAQSGSSLSSSAIATNVSAVQSNNIVNTKAAYDIIFRTASAGAIKTIEMTFPARTNVQNAPIVEVSGIGRGTSSVNAQTMTYTVTNAVNVPINTFLRFEIWNIVNSPTANPNLAIQVTTKNSVGGVIDSGTSASYSIKQITRGDIATDAVTADKIAGVSKLIFQSCDGNPTVIQPSQIIAVQCPVPGALLQDNVLITTPFVCLGGDPNQNPPPSGRCLEVLGGRVSNAGVVSIYIINDITPLTNVNTGPMKFSMIVFKP